MNVDNNSSVAENLSSASEKSDRNQRIHCPICYKIFSSPRMIVMTSRCGHVICRNCFDKIEEDCPYCREFLNKLNDPIRVRFRFNKK